MLRALFASCLILVSSVPLGAQEPPLNRAPPDQLLGHFEDDYGIRYEVTHGLWLQGAGARYEIAEWAIEGQYLIARNGEGNRTEAGLWTRIDWVMLDATDDYAWAFCYATYSAGSRTEALAAAPSAREAPRSGCNGYPFSRMRRVESVDRSQSPVVRRLA